MSVQRELTRSFRKSPRPLIDAVVDACEIPEINPASVRKFRFPPILGWQVGLADPMHRHFVLLLDIATTLDEERVWQWQLWRTEARAQTLSPAWLAVCVIDESVLAGIRKAFDHDPANLPILVTPDAKVLAIPSRPPPRPPVPLFV